jgi:hypothetical protein
MKLILPLSSLDSFTQVIGSVLNPFHGQYDRSYNIKNDTIVTIVLLWHSNNGRTDYEKGHQSKENFTETVRTLNQLRHYCNHRLTTGVCMNKLDRESHVHVLQAIDKLQSELRQDAERNDELRYCINSDRLRALIRCLDTGALIDVLEDEEK